MELITILDELNYIIKIAKERGQEDIAREAENVRYSIEQLYEEEIIEIKQNWLLEIDNYGIKN